MSTRRVCRALWATLVLGLSTATVAGEVGIEAATLRAEGYGRWHAEVTLRHDDTGWEHYADAWRVVGADGRIYGTRTLHHPHVDEQPFTRSLSGITVPAGSVEVWIEAHDKLHGWSGNRRRVDLTTAQ